MGPKAEPIARLFVDRFACGPESGEICGAGRRCDDNGKRRKVGDWPKSGALVLTRFHVIGYEIMLNAMRNQTQLQDEQEESD